MRVAVKKDRMTVMVRDPYWLHAHWELARPTVERARAALGQESAHRQADACGSTRDSELSATMPESDHGPPHRNSWRREQLVIEVRKSPEVLPDGNRVSCGLRGFYSLARSNTVRRRALVPVTRSTATGATWRKTSTAFSR